MRDPQPQSPKTTPNPKKLITIILNTKIRLIHRRVDVIYYSRFTLIIMIYRLLLISFFVITCNTWADWAAEEKKIEFLINEVEKVNGTFIRNGKSHPPKKAASHLRMKLDNSFNNWFAPSKDKWTAELFIEKIASQSSLSRKPYYIQFSDGKKVPSKIWLTEKLKSYKSSPQ